MGLGHSRPLVVPGLRNPSYWTRWVWDFWPFFGHDEIYAYRILTTVQFPFRLGFDARLNRWTNVVTYQIRDGKLTLYPGYPQAWYRHYFGNR
jgi:hypothetical protein